MLYCWWENDKKSLCRLYTKALCVCSCLYGCYKPVRVQSTCVHIYMEAEGQPLLLFLSSHPTYVFEGLLWNLLNMGDQLVREPRGFSCLHSLKAELTSIYHYAWVFYMDSQDWTQLFVLVREAHYLSNAIKCTNICICIIYAYHMCVIYSIYIPYKLDWIQKPRTCLYRV